MKRIFWGVMGEGLGHVTRTLAAIEHLRECEVHIFTSGKALAYLAVDRLSARPCDRRSDVPLSRRASCPIRVAARSGSFLPALCAGNVRKILEAADRLQPDLFVTDFEPSLPVAAECWGGSLLSVDNQHRFSHCSVRDLPFGLRCYALVVGRYIHWAMGQPKVAVISTFCPDTCGPPPRMPSWWTL